MVVAGESDIVAVFRVAIWKEFLGVDYPLEFFFIEHEDIVYLGKEIRF